MAEVKGFTFWGHYYTTISDPDNELSEEQKAQLYMAIVEYIFAEKIPDFKGVTKVVFSALLPSLEKSKVRSKAKQNKIKAKTKQNQNEIKTKRKESFDFEEKEHPQKEKAGQKEKYPQEKEYIFSPPITPRSGQARFFEEFPSVVIDNYDAATLAGLTEEDWETIAEQFRKSDWLRKNVKTMSTLCRLSARIIAGQYAPFEKVQTEQDEDLSEDERRENAKWFEETFGSGGE